MPATLFLALCGISPCGRPADLESHSLKKPSLLLQHYKYPLQRPIHHHHLSLSLSLTQIYVVMSHVDHLHHQAPVAYPPPVEAYPQGHPYSAPPPPPAGYPMEVGHGYTQIPPPVETKSRGDGFWKGCCAALCCCCVLDACF